MFIFFKYFQAVICITRTLPHNKFPLMQTLIHGGGSLDRALNTPGRVNTIGAIRGGAYVKLPREGNW